MAYTYHDFESQATDAAILARLVLHIAEVRLQIGPSLSSQGSSRDAATVLEYLKTLETRR